MPSDKEYVEKIIRNYELRKKRAAFFGVMSIIFASLAYFSYVAFTEKTDDIASSISSTLIEGRTLTETDIKLVEVNNEFSYVTGLRVGQLLNIFTAAAGISFGYCLYLLFWPRKERIIKELYEKDKF